MVELTCCVCGTVFTVSDSIYHQRKRDGKEFFCPNGHSQIFTNSLASQITDLKRQFRTAEADRIWFMDRYHEAQREIRHLHHAKNGMKGRLVQALRKGQGVE